MVLPPAFVAAQLINAVQAYILLRHDVLKIGRWDTGMFLSQCARWVAVRMEASSHGTSQHPRQGVHLATVLKQDVHALPPFPICSDQHPTLEEVTAHAPYGEARVPLGCSLSRRVFSLRGCQVLLLYVTHRHTRGLKWETAPLPCPPEMRRSSPAPPRNRIPHTPAPGSPRILRWYRTSVCAYVLGLSTWQLGLSPAARFTELCPWFTMW